MGLQEVNLFSSKCFHYDKKYNTALASVCTVKEVSNLNNTDQGIPLCVPLFPCVKDRKVTVFLCKAYRF